MHSARPCSGSLQGWWAWASLWGWRCPACSSHAVCHYSAIADLWQRLYFAMRDTPPSALSDHRSPASADAACQHKASDGSAISSGRQAARWTGSIVGICRSYRVGPVSAPSTTSSPFSSAGTCGRRTTS